MRWSARSLGLLLPLLLACGEDTTTGTLAPGVMGLAVEAVAPPSLARFGPNLAVEQVRVVVTRLVNDIPDTVARRVASWDPSASQLNLALSFVALQQAETLQVALDYETATGIVLFSAFQSVVARAGQATALPPAQPFYVGPGNNVAFIAITPPDPTVGAGDSVLFTVSAIDSFQAPVPSLYVSWSATGGTIDALGLFRAPAAAGTVQVIAQTPNGTADTTSVSIIPAGAGAIAGRVVDASTLQGLGGVAVTVLDQAGAQVASLLTAFDGSYITPPLPPGTYRVDVALSGFVSTTLFDATLPSGGATTVATIPLAPAGRSAGILGGVVLDATTDLPIPGATVEIRDGVNATTGTALLTLISDSVGGFVFSAVPPGTYTISAAIAGYVDGRRTSTSLSGISSLTENVVLSPAGASDVRVVLTWGASPADLDAHLTGPGVSSGTRFHVYFGNPGDPAADPFASLDVDQTDGFGPETITVTQQRNGIYRFSVHDYSNSDLNPSTALASSGAKVDLYVAGALVRSFFVPNQPGTLWTVFELDGTTLTAVNTMSYEVNSDAVSLRRPDGVTTDASVIRADRIVKP